MTKIKFNIIVILIFLSFSCKREKVTKHHSDLCGYWRHHTDSQETQYLTIESNGTGLMEWWTNDKITKNTARRQWFVKDDYLMLGRLTSKKDDEAFKITMYPSISTYSFITEYDTVRLGDKYMTLNNKTFVIWRK